MCWVIKNTMLSENVASDREYHLSGMARRGTRQSQDLERDECTQQERPISGSAMKASATRKARQPTLAKLSPGPGRASKVTTVHQGRGKGTQRNSRANECQTGHWVSQEQGLGSQGLSLRAKAYGNHRQGCSKLSPHASQRVACAREAQEA